MIEILKETDQRLVLALDRKGRRRAKFILDKESGQAWFERLGRLLPSRTAQTPIAEIAAVEALGGRLVLTLKSGVRRAFAADPESAREAAARIRTFVGLTEENAAVSPARITARWLRIAAWSPLGVAVVVLLGLGGFKIADLFILPACDAQRTRDTVHDLLQSKSASSISLGKFATISYDENEYRCSAEITVNSDRAVVGYRSYWDGRSAFVRITGALGAARLDPARIRSIDQAYDDFMAGATDAYQSGNPPRQSDPAINTLLTTIFDVLGVPSKTLAGADIDEAIRWFNSGDTVGAVYLLAGTGVNDIAQLPPDEAVQKKLRANVVKFSDEFGRYADFQVTLLAAIADAQQSFGTSGPPGEVDTAEFRSKADGIKSLLAQALKTDFISLVYEGLSDPWRLQRLDVIARIAPVAAKVLGRDDVTAIRDQALQTLPYFSNEAVQVRVSEVAGMIAGR